MKYWQRYPIWMHGLLGVSMITLSACTKTLDTIKLEGDIKQAVVQQGGGSLKAVACPKHVALASGKGFECVGTLESGENLAIPVNQVDDQGKTTWDVPSTKGLLNLPQLASLFQQTIQQEGQALTIDCGKGYRSVQPGDRFECKVSKDAEKSAQPKKPGEKKSLPPKRPETIAVTIDPQNNVNWQQVVTVTTVEIASAQKTVTTDNSSDTPPSPAIAEEDRAKLSPAVLKSLDQMGGGDME